MLRMQIIKVLLFHVFLTSFSASANSEMDLLSKFHQKGFKVKFERLDLQYYNKDYIDYANVVTFKYNRTVAVSNITVIPKIDVDGKSTVIVQIYKLLSNEYRRYAIRFQVNLCNAINADMVGLSQITTSGNFSTECGFNKGVIYHAYNFAVEESKFPPLIPNGNYKGEFNVYVKNTLILTINGLAEVYRPIRY